MYLAIVNEFMGVLAVLAADSAVTVNSSSGTKIYNTALNSELYLENNELIMQF